MDKELYDARAVSSTVKVYNEEGVGSFEIKERENSFVVKSNVDDEEIEGEFCNFLIAETKHLSNTSKQ